MLSNVSRYTNGKFIFIKSIDLITEKIIEFKMIDTKIHKSLLQKSLINMI